LTKKIDETLKVEFKAKEKNFFDSYSFENLNYIKKITIPSAEHIYIYLLSEQ